MTSWNDLAEIEQVKHEKAEQETYDNLLLIDGVNLAFRYLHRKNYNSFSDDYIKTVTSLGKSYEAKRIICMFDSGPSVYRNMLLPSYKDNRKVEREPEEQERFNDFFECLYNTVDLLPFEHYKFRGIEADDVIAYLSKQLKNKYTHTWIVSSDKDLYQLLNNTTSIFNIFSRKEITEQSLYDDLGLSPREFMLARVIMGDVGDNVIGVNGIGIKRASALAREHKTLDNLLNALPLKGRAQYIKNLNEFRDKLILNEKLINLNDYFSDVVEHLEKKDLILTMLNEAINK